VARLRAGQQVWLKVTPWQVVEPRYGRFARVEPDEPGRDLLALPAWWGELME